jgi:hypothetical protein
MKKAFLILLMAFITCQIDINGQDTDERFPVDDNVQYTYDAAGNRITRSIIQIIAPLKDVETENPQDAAEEREILVYPNPVKESFTIDIFKGDNDNSYRFLLFDMGGKLIREIKQHGNGKTSFDMGMYQHGTYVLIIDMGDGKKEFKIIKE